MAFNLLVGFGLLRRQVLYPAELRAHTVRSGVESVRFPPTL